MLTTLRWAILLSACFSLLAHAEVIGKTVSYRAGGVTMKGYIAYNDSLTKRHPGVLVVPEWWGLTDYIRIRARMLAKLGYTALAVDMYGNGKTTQDPKQAKALADYIRSDLPLMKLRFEAALRRLKDDNTVLNTQTAAIGYCFGGGVVLEMARQGERVRGVVSFHGNLTTKHPAQKGKVRAQVLVLNGGADPLVTPAQITAFKQEMEKAGVKYQFISYPDAKHGFTNPASTYLGDEYHLPIAYDEKADVASWREMKRFLAKVLY